MPPPTPPIVNDGRMIGGKAGAGDRGHRLVERLDHRRRRRVDADLGHRVAEQLPVFRDLDRLDRGADQLHAVLGEDAVLLELDGQVERGLAADGRQHRVRPLALDDLGDDVDGERLDVGAVGQLRVGHDRRRVAVDQHDFEAFGAQRLAGLGARVVELARLADDDRARADDEDAADVGTLGHLFLPVDRVEELPEQVVGVVRAGRRLRVVLHAEDRQLAMLQAFDRVVVQVQVRDLDVVRQRLGGRRRSRGSAT